MSGSDKVRLLLDHLERLGSVLVCYSGGVDSALVLAAAHRALNSRAIGMTAVSPSLAASELDDARAIAAQIGADHRLVDSSEIDDPDYQANGPDRCFHCKSELYRIAARKQIEWGLGHVVNGTNTDDLGDYRPGLEAATRAGVRSPLVELGFDKADVRACAQALGLEVWDKPAAACLSSRLPFGTRVTRERLTRIGGLEASLRILGFKRVRVRYHPIGDAGASPEQAIARIEVDASEIARAASETVRDALVRAGRAA